jgi:Zn finger protein HypA/HybF involved in hydrogenase expression
MRKMTDQTTNQQTVGLINIECILCHTNVLVKNKSFRYCPPCREKRLKERHEQRKILCKTRYKDKKYVKKPGASAAQIKERKCLNCHKLFLSTSAGHRICYSCKNNHDYKQTVGEEYKILL